MPETAITLEPELHARLTQWAEAHHRTLPELIQIHLVVAQVARANYEPMPYDSKYETKDPIL